MLSNGEYTLLIDAREQQLKKFFQSKKNVVVTNLDIGDIVIKKDDDVILIFERKTITDLSAYICDGRHREQKTRMLLVGIPRDRIIYLIEGDITQTTTIKGGTSTLLGCLVNTLLRDGIKVYKTQSIDETIIFIDKVFEKITKEHEEFWKYNSEIAITNSKYSASLKTKKKSNMTPEVLFHAQLELIPGVSNKIAEAITSKYKTLKTLQVKYNELDKDSSKNILKDITYESNGKNRKVGPVVSKKVYSYICGEED